MKKAENNEVFDVSDTAIFNNVTRFFTYTATALSCATMSFLTNSFLEKLSLNQSLILASVATIFVSIATLELVLAAVTKLFSVMEENHKSSSPKEKEEEDDFF